MQSPVTCHPEGSAAEIIHTELQAELDPTPSPAALIRSPEELRSLLDVLTFNSDKIPPMPGETFFREMICQDHDECAVRHG